jgi:hypothetical protein
MTDHTATLAITLLMALVYLGVVRLVDMNEKEPLWAVAMLFAFGGLAACGLGLGVNLAVLELRVLPAAMAKELARFVAIGAGVGVLTLLGWRRGWSEINGLMDGVVYGAAGGFGYATGEVFIRDLLVGPLSTALGIGARSLSLSSVASVALVGLGDGVFGALMGIGLAAALYARKPVQRALFPLASYLAAVSAHVSYELLGRGNAFGGAEGLVRRWAALLLPALVVALVVVVALAQEKRAIRDELGDEADTGIVTLQEREVLRSAWAREILYVKALLRGEIGTWLTLRGLHNRQVQLALAKRQAAEARRSNGAGAFSPEVQQLRVAIVALKRALERPALAPEATDEREPSEPKDGDRSTKSGDE